MFYVLGINQTGDVGVTTEGNIPDANKKKQFLLCLLLEYDKNLPKTETKLFEFSQDTNREELKIRKNNITLKCMLHWFPLLALALFLTKSYTEKYWPAIKNL